MNVPVRVVIDTNIKLDARRLFDPAHDLDAAGDLFRCDMVKEEGLTRVADFAVGRVRSALGRFPTGGNHLLHVGEDFVARLATDSTGAVDGNAIAAGAAEQDVYGSVERFAADVPQSHDDGAHGAARGAGVAVGRSVLEQRFPDAFDVARVATDEEGGVVADDGDEFVDATVELADAGYALIRVDENPGMFTRQL